jgi:hypothetical protein
VDKQKTKVYLYETEQQWTNAEKNEVRLCSALSVCVCGCVCWPRSVLAQSVSALSEVRLSAACWCFLRWQKNKPLVVLTTSTVANADAVAVRIARHIHTACLPACPPLASPRQTFLEPAASRSLTLLCRFAVSVSVRCQIAAPVTQNQCSTLTVDVSTVRQVCWPTAKQVLCASLCARLARLRLVARFCSGPGRACWARCR